MSTKRYTAGSRLEDMCRACKLVRRHTVMAAGQQGEPLRVVCDYCGSQHNYRGGERERSKPAMGIEEPGGGGDLERLLRRVIREETGLTPVTPAERWRGGEMVLRPGKPGLQEKTWPIETLFAKIVMIRNRLRVLEQQINGADLPGDVKLKLQGYITTCYGSLTSFNVLFADEDDRFRGTGGASSRSSGPER